MATSKPKPPSPFAGRWRIISMSAWDRGFVDEEEEGYIKFDGLGIVGDPSGVERDMLSAQTVPSCSLRGPGCVGPTRSRSYGESPTLLTMSNH